MTRPSLSWGAGVFDAIVAGLPGGRPVLLHGFPRTGLVRKRQIGGEYGDHCASGMASSSAAETCRTRTAQWLWADHPQMPEFTGAWSAPSQQGSRTVLPHGWP